MITFRALTQEELEGFKSRHPFYWLPFIPAEGKYIQDTTLGGYVLIFKLQSGDVTFTFTSEDPSVSDPSKTGYIIRETAKAAGKATGDLLRGTGEVTGQILAGATGAVAEGLKPLTGVGIFALAAGVLVLLYISKVK